MRVFAFVLVWYKRSFGRLEWSFYRRRRFQVLVMLRRWISIRLIGKGGCLLGLNRVSDIKSDFVEMFYFLLGRSWLWRLCLVVLSLNLLELQLIVVDLYVVKVLSMIIFPFLRWGFRIIGIAKSEEIFFEFLKFLSRKLPIEQMNLVIPLFFYFFRRGTVQLIDNRRL